MAELLKQITSRNKSFFTVVEQKKYQKRAAEKNSIEQEIVNLALAHVSKIRSITATIEACQNEFEQLDLKMERYKEANARIPGVKKAYSYDKNAMDIYRKYYNKNQKNSKLKMGSDVDDEEEKAVSKKNKKNREKIVNKKKIQKPVSDTDSESSDSEAESSGSEAESDVEESKVESDSESDVKEEFKAAATAYVDLANDYETDSEVEENDSKIKKNDVASLNLPMENLNLGSDSKTPKLKIQHDNKHVDNAMDEDDIASTPKKADKGKQRTKPKEQQTEPKKEKDAATKKKKGSKSSK